MKILFICLSTLKFDVRTPYVEPLGGTESALAYLSIEMAKLGHDVTLMSQTEEKILEGVKHLPVSENIEHVNPDVVIVTSAPQAIPAIANLVPRAKVVLWNHMQPDQPAMLHFFQPETRKHIHNIVYVSDSQKKIFLEWQKKIEEPEAVVINNAISPAFENMFSSAHDILEVKKCRGAYTSTPYRGLAVLTSIKEIPIDVYSSMAVYQGDDSSFVPMYEGLKTNDCIEMHGSISQFELKERLREAAFLVYPSIFTECHSIAIIEAMGAGLKVITTDMASPQTEYIDSISSKDSSLDMYTHMLRRNINYFRAHPEEWAAKMFEQVQYVNREFTWTKRAKEWEQYLNSITQLPRSA